MEMDLTLCGGLRPLLGHGGEMETRLWTKTRKNIWTLLVSETRGGRTGGRGIIQHVPESLGQICCEKVPQ